MTMPDRHLKVITGSFFCLGCITAARNLILPLGQGKREFAGAPHVVDSQDVHLGAMMVSCGDSWEVILFEMQSSGSTWYAVHQLSRRPKLLQPTVGL